MLFPIRRTRLLQATARWRFCSRWRAVPEQYRSADSCYALHIETLEAFFGTRLQFCDRSLSQGQWLTYCDGFVHWHVLWDHERQLLKIAADREPRLTALPTVEVEGFYSNISVSPLTGGYVTLVLQPVGARDSMNWLVMTKTADGRLSLSTMCGNPHQIAEPGAPPNGGTATPVGNSAVTGGRHR